MFALLSRVGGRERTGVTTYGHTRGIDRLGPGHVYDRHGNEHALKLIQIIGPRPKFTARQMRDRIYRLPWRQGP